MKLFIISGLTACLILCLAPAVKAVEPAIVEVRLNSVEKGEYVVRATEDGDFLIRGSDLELIGLHGFNGREIPVENRTYISLKSIPGVTFDFDNSYQILKIQAAPVLLESRSVDFSPGPRSDVSYPSENSLFINYGFNEQVAAGSGAASLFTATQEIGMRRGNYLFLSDSMITHNENTRGASRLMTRLIHDDRSTLRRTVIGDFYTSSETLGSSLLMAGVSFSKKYTMDPTLWRYSTLDYEGFVSLPSQIDVYMDGTQIGSEQFSPGGFGLSNIPVGSGLHNMEIRVRDSLGRERRVDLSLYSSNTVLRKGFHDYEYHVGIRRKDFGSAGDHYSGAAFVAAHRYGLFNIMTVGFRAEGGSGLVNAGPQASLRLGHYGVTDANLSFSTESPGRRGMALSLSHTFQGRQINLRLQASAYGRRYSTVTTASSPELTERPRFSFGTAFSYGNRTLGSLTFDLKAIKKYIGENFKSYAVTYTRYLAKRMSLSVNYRHFGNDLMDNAVYIGLTYYPGRGMTVSNSYQRDGESDVTTVNMHKNPPAGSGFSYRMQFMKRHYSGSSNTLVNPRVQYKGRYGIYAAEYRGGLGLDSEEKNAYSFSASGGLVFAGNSWGFTRPVYDSFAVVRTGNLEGVRTYLNNHEIGRTNSRGEIIIPDLNSYVNNIISINDKDVPVNYALEDISLRFSPPWRSGTPVHFNTKKLQAFIGAVYLNTDSGTIPVEFADMRIADTPAIHFLTGHDGEFYLENVPAGLHEVQFDYDQRSYVFVLDIPEKDDMIVDLGKVIIEKSD